MFRRRYLRVCLIAAIILTFIGNFTVAQPTEAASRRQVWAYYFGWHTGSSWGDGRLKDRPAQLYDSADAGAVGRHIDQAMGTGIDAFIMSWFGPKNGNLTNGVFNMLLEQAAARGFHAAVSVDMQEGGYNATTGEVIESLSYLLNDRVNHPGYLRYNNKPVIYFWNQGRFSGADWANIRAQIDPKHTSIWMMEGTDTSLLNTFDGLYLFNIAWSKNFGGTAAGWKSRTFRAGGTFYTPTVMPGWDESAIGGRPNPTEPQARTTDFLTRSWRGAVAAGSPAILIVSWNEYLENSHIEPSEKTGTAALDTLRPLIQRWKGIRPTTRNTGAPTRNDWQGKNLTPTAEVVNVRSGAGTNYKQLGQIKRGEVYPIKNMVGEWFEIDFQGQKAYVFSQVVQYV